MIPKRAQTAQKATQKATANSIPLSVQNIRADERPFYDALWTLHQRAPAPDVYLEALADLMREYLQPAARDVIARHIALNRRELQEMQPLDAWRDVFAAAADGWLDMEYIPTRTSQISATLAEYGDQIAEKAYTQARAAMLAVTMLSDMGMVDALCGYTVVILSRRQAVMREREQQP